MNFYNKSMTDNHRAEDTTLKETLLIKNEYVC